jgi:RNA polymerase sigma factor (sigma-70 family)
VVDPQASPERQAERALVLAKVKECLGRLKAERRRALALHLQGFTTEEIGRLLGWTEPRARNLVYRGLKQLRETLRSAGIDYVLD